MAAWRAPDRVVAERRAGTGVGARRVSESRWLCCPGPVVVCAAGGRRPPGSGLEAQDADAVERGDEIGGPGPTGGEAESSATAGAGDLAGGVQPAIAQAFGFGAGEVTVEGDASSPGEQVVSDERGGEPGGVDGEVGRGQVGQAGVFEVADQLLGPASTPLEGFEAGDVGVGLIGDEHLEAVTVEVGEGQLGAGVGFLAAGRGPGAVGAAGEVDQN